ncbi:MAG: hypothetical protein SCH71_16770 [Desulfobulbaceae bacterium]|nr:hypothetical protein [Desulfobulbaceae bacterium]
MKRVNPISLMILSCVLLVLSLGSAALAEPLAPASKFSKKGIKILKSSNQTPKDFEKDIPSKEEVDIPVYPGATVSYVLEPGTGLPPTVNLISNDPPDKVKEWYRKNLEGWGYSDMLNLFYEGTQEPQIAELFEGKYQTVAVMEETGEGLDLLLFEVPDVKTRIQIVYKIKGN